MDRGRRIESIGYHLGRLPGVRNISCYSGVGTPGHDESLMRQFQRFIRQVETGKARRCGDFQNSLRPAVAAQRANAQRDKHFSSYWPILLVCF